MQGNILPLPFDWVDSSFQFSAISVPFLSFFKKNNNNFSLSVRFLPLSALTGMAVHIMLSAFGSHLFPPLIKFFGFVPGAAGLPCMSPWAFAWVGFLSIMGGLHSLAGAHGGRPAGHLEWCCDTAAPCWCFCSCCLTCCMISRILLCAVCCMTSHGGQSVSLGIKHCSVRMYCATCTHWVLIDFVGLLSQHQRTLTETTIKTSPDQTVRRVLVIATVMFVPDWHRNVRWFSQRPRHSHLEFGPVVRWPLHT